MLLTAAGGGPSITRQVKPKDEIALHFSVATPQGQSHYRTQAVVARLLDSGNGVGVVFQQGIPKDAYEALMEFSVATGSAPEVDDDDEDDVDDEVIEETPQTADGKTSEPPVLDSPATPEVADKRAKRAAKRARKAEARNKMQIPDDLLRDKRLPAEKAKELRMRIHRLMQRALQRISNQFFANVQNELLVKARDSGTNAVEMMYLEGLDLLEKAEPEVRQSFTKHVLEQIETVSDIEQMLERRRRRETGNSTTGQLALVDTDEFEHWLAVAEVISKAENRFSDSLLDIRAQLGLIAKPWSHKDVVPVGPAAICWAFDDAIANLDFRRQVQQDVYRCFEQSLTPVLANIYAALNQLLEESGAFPSLENLRESLQRGLIRRSASGVKVEPEVYQEMDTAVREAAMAADGVANTRVDFNPFVEPSGGRQAYSAARNILDLNRRTAALLGKEREDMLAAPNARPEEKFDSSEILEAISLIEQEMGDTPVRDKRLKPLLMDVLRKRHGDRKAFSEEDFDTLNVMEGLVDSISQDTFITEGIREWVQRLEFTLNKLAAQDPRFLQHDPAQPHSAVQMLNQLARLGNSRDVREGIDREVGRRVDELLQRVVSEYDDNPDVFNEVVSELNPLVDKQTRAYRGNVERTVRSSEGQQKLARARRAVTSELESRLDGKEVPDLLLQTLNPGWRNLLVHTHLRKGPDSNEWRDALSLVDQLSGQLSGEIDETSDEYVDSEHLLRRVVDGLDTISFDPSKRTPLVMGLSSALVGDASGEKSQPAMVEVKSGGTAKALGLEGLLPDTAPTLEDADEDVQAHFAKAVARARRMQVGEWLATSDAQGRPLILTVAFVGDDHSSFVLVNRKGIKSKELSLKEMADELHSGQVTLLDDYDLPLMERASQRMLENMHNQLAYQASHDDLTQLINRKEFERAVEAAINTAKAREQQHALLYVDLDQFKIINNTSGHTAGDELLKQIGDAISSAMSNENAGDAKIARLGGDEFGVLLENVETARARELAETVLSAVRGLRFEWEGRVYNQSASMGLVFIDRTTENVDTAMQHADEACYSAKDAGRNRLQEYELGDSRMIQRHGVMEWVTQLDKALEDNRLVLNCQRISPVVPQNDSADHYEILLTMQDELGDMMPPTEFIMAAETYNRMTTVDRWVIKNVLEWMSEHRDQLDSFDGFAINVSGHSINDETFPDFVLEQFSATQAPTGKVCFEITETAAIANLDNAVDFMNRMKIIGCQFSLDDFGTGLSSYSYLRNLPVDFVKIDGVFVRDIANNPATTRWCARSTRSATTWASGPLRSSSKTTTCSTG